MHNRNSHNTINHGLDFVCQICGLLNNNTFNLKKHMETNHQQESTNSHFTSREVCRNWRQGNCNRGNFCRFSHPGQQDVSNSTDKNTPRFCKYGQWRSYLAKGSCRFFHPGHNDQSRQTVKQSEGQSRYSSRQYGGTNKNGGQYQQQYWFNGKCNQAPYCPFFTQCRTSLPFKGYHNH